MRWIIPLAVLPLVACALPGRDTLAPTPVAADVQSIAASQAFAGRIALVSIQPGTQDFAAPLKSAVDQALAIKPGAMFEVRAVAPESDKPDAQATELRALVPLAAQVVQAITADGVQPGNVALTAGTGSTSTEILVFVK